MKKIFLIDGDNNINLGLRGIEMLPEDNVVLIFHSKAMEITKFQKKLAGCRAKIEFIESVRSGKNSLDFQITTELGFLSNQKDLQYAYIISCDKGYDAAIDYVKSRYSSKFRELERKESIFDCFQLAYLLKTRNKQELQNALVKEHGTDHGNLVFEHLKTLFGDTAEAAEPAEQTVAEAVTEKVEQKAAKAAAKVAAVSEAVKSGRGNGRGRRGESARTRGERSSRGKKFAEMKAEEFQVEEIEGEEFRVEILPEEEPAADDFGTVEEEAIAVEWFGEELEGTAEVPYSVKGAASVLKAEKNEERIASDEKKAKKRGVKFIEKKTVVTQSASEKVHQAKETVEASAEKLAEKLAEASESDAVKIVKEPVMKAVEAVKEPVEKVVESAKEPVAKAVEAVKEPVAKAVETVREPVTKAVEKAKAVTEEVKAEVKEAAPVEMLKGYNVPLRFGAVRTEEQNQSFYKNRDLRKKKAVKAEDTVMEAEAERREDVSDAGKAEDHMDSVVEVIREARRSMDQEESAEAPKESRRRNDSGRRQGRRDSQRTDRRRSDSGERKERSERGERAERSSRRERSAENDGQENRRTGRTNRRARGEQAATEHREGKVAEIREKRAEAVKEVEAVEVKAEAAKAEAKTAEAKTPEVKVQEKSAAGMEAAAQRSAAKTNGSSGRSAGSNAVKKSRSNGPGFFGRMFTKKK